MFMDTFSEWTEAFPTKTKTAKKLLEDILSRYGFPHIIGSDNGPAFMSKVSQDVARHIEADWKLHCVYRPQSSGQAERMNQRDCNRGEGSIAIRDSTLCSLTHVFAWDPLKQTF